MGVLLSMSRRILFGPRGSRAYCAALTLACLKLLPSRCARIARAAAESRRPIQSVCYCRVIAPRPPTMSTLLPATTLVPGDEPRIVAPAPTTTPALVFCVTRQYEIGRAHV